MPTMNDVAKLAGVSRGTVSNYINGVKVKEASQKKIQSAIEELDYIPNVTARELKMNRSNVVVFILPTTHTPFFAELTHEIQQALKKEKFKMLLCNSNNEIKEELEYIQMGKEQKVAGVITISYSDLAPYLTTDLPIVSIEKRIAPNIPCVSSDNYKGGELAAKKLVEKGSKNLLLVTRNTKKTAFNYGERAQGFADYCQENHIAYTVFQSMNHEDKFYPELKQFLIETYKETCVYDGIFAVADQYADFCLSTLQMLDYPIPAAIQIIGFDGGKMYPQQERFISSIRQPVQQIAQNCIKALKQIFNNDVINAQETIFLPVEYLEGKTTRK